MNFNSSSPSADGPGLIAVIDIGSNSVRMVVYDSLSRVPIPVFNEKVNCKLDIGLHATHRLCDEKIALTLGTLERFSILIRNMGISDLIAVATAAVRDAENGQDFATKASAILGQPIQILSGNQEAQLSALGLLSVFSHVDGIVGDLGGGSLELAEINNGQITHSVSLPLGHHRLADMANDSLDEAKALVDRYLQDIPWLQHMENRTFYAIGGRWRKVAEIFMEETDYPIHLVHHFTLCKEFLDQGIDYANFQPKKKSSKKNRNEGDSNKPAAPEPVQYAGLTLERIFHFGQPKQIIFSGTSLREGCLYQRLEPEARQEDPLLSVCQKVVRHNTWMPSNDNEAYQWLLPIIEFEKVCAPRLFRVATMLSDISAVEPTDYKASLAFHHLLSITLPDLDHPDRIFLALAIYIRYTGRLRKRSIFEPYLSLIDEPRVRQAEQLGLGLRLAHIVSRGARNILPELSLTLRGEHQLVLALPKAMAVMAGDAVQDTLKDLAKAFGRSAQVEILEKVILPR